MEFLLLFILLFLVLVGWYVYMSFIDWFIHKHILHNDQSIITFLRHHHKNHHLSFDKVIEEYAYGIAFDYMESGVIALVSGIPIFLLAWALSLEPAWILGLLMLHVVGVFIGVGIHNYFHTVFHDHSLFSVKNTLYVPVPSWVYTFLQEHHRRHHENPKTNFCITWIGFDSFIGTCFDENQDKKIV